MGLKLSELVPISSNGPTPLIPSGKPTLVKVIQVLRTDTAAGILKAVLPAQSTIINIDILGSVNSNAGTTAAVTLNVSNNTGVISTGTVNVLANGATTNNVTMTNLPNVEPQPLLGDLKITAQYAETGTASSLGGPYTFVITYV